MIDSYTSHDKMVYFLIITHYRHSKDSSRSDGFHLDGVVICKYQNVLQGTKIFSIALVPEYE